MKHLLHDVFCHSLRILNQYASIFDLICKHHICVCVYYVHLYKINILSMRCICLLYVQFFKHLLHGVLDFVLINSTILYCVSAIIMFFSIAFFNLFLDKNKILIDKYLLLIRFSCLINHIDLRINLIEIHFSISSCNYCF